MNTIVFVQREIEDKLGPMILTSYLKSHGFPSHIIIDPLRRIGALQRMNPTVIGISVLSPSATWALTMAKTLKQRFPRAFIILGGPHPTYFPELIENEGVDAVCLGEGEKALLSIMSSYDGTLASVEGSPNCWIKNGPTITKNPLADLLTDEELTQLPFSDRSHYADYPALRESPHKKIWTSRGCPYRCSFCFNHRYNEMYKGHGKVVRYRSVAGVISELKELKKYGWKTLEIVDDQFLLSKEWLFDFCDQYAREIGMPFACASSAKHVTIETVAALKRAGCKTLSFGVESGVERIRREIYNKPVTNEEIYRAAEILNNAGLPFMTFNIIGLPEERVEDILETIEINRKIHTPYPWCSILQPYPGTHIAAYLKEQGVHLEPNFSYSYFTSSTLQDPERARLFSNAQKLFSYFVKSDLSPKRMRAMIQHPPLHVDRLYPLVFYSQYGRAIRERYGLSWWSLLRYWFYSREG